MPPTPLPPHVAQVPRVHWPSASRQPVGESCPSSWTVILPTPPGGWKVTVELGAAEANPARIARIPTECMLMVVEIAAEDLELDVYLSRRGGEVMACRPLLYIHIVATFVEVRNNHFERVLLV
jgi:hypothetical protein